MYKFDCEVLDHAIRAILNTLGDEVSLLPASLPHATIYASGFLVKEKLNSNEITYPDISSQIEAIRQLDSLTPKLRITGIGANPLILYFRIRDESPTTLKIRSVLKKFDGEYRSDDFFFHVTLAHYMSNVPVSLLKTRLDKFYNFDSFSPANTSLELVKLRANQPIRPDVGLCSEIHKTIFAYPIKSMERCNLIC